MTPWTASCQASLSFTISQSLLKLTSIESVMPSSHLILYHPLLLPSIFPSIRVFSTESGFLCQMAKVLELQLQHLFSSEYSGLISFRIDWFDLLAVQETLKSLLQHHSSKASIPLLRILWLLPTIHLSDSTNNKNSLFKVSSLHKELYKVNLPYSILSCSVMFDSLRPHGL